MQKYVEQTVADTAIRVEKLNGAIEPSPVSRTDTPVFTTLRRLIRAVYPEAVTAPYLVMGATDSRYYARVTDRVYRFSPVFLQKADLSRIHGINERVRTNSFTQAIRFYYHLVQALQ